MGIGLAYACVLIAALLPYIWVAIAKAGAHRYDNRDPRGWMARQTAARVVRANAAHLNAFEAFPAFAAGVLMAQLAGIAPARIALLALIFVVARVFHGIFYLTDRDTLRSLAWFAGLASVLALLGQAVAAAARAS